MRNVEEFKRKNRMTRISKYGSFADNCPELLKEWSYEDNDKLKIFPDQITSHCGEKVYWICPICEQKYLAQVAHRANGTACPSCAREFKTSFPEQAIYYYFKKIYSDTKNRFYVEEKEIDIYIPSLKIGIEYDGKYYHKGKKNKLREQDKYNVLKTNHIKLIRIKEIKKEEELDLEIADYIFYIEKSKKIKDLEEVIKKIFDLLKIKEKDIDIERDREDIYKQYICNIKESGIDKTNPELLEEWDLDKNEPLKPSMFSKGSEKKVWWKCKKCGESWQAQIYTRVKGHGCPFCAGIKLIKGKNDLRTLYPEIAKRWDTKKNKLDASEVMPNSNEKAWWICGLGHSFNSKISHVVNSKKEGCPYCNGKIVLEGFNDLKSQRPDLMEEWDWEKNNKNGIFPNQVTCGSTSKIVWWKCKNCGNEWQTTVYQRGIRNCGCNKCKSKRK